MPSILPTTLYVLHLASPYAYKETRVGNGEVSGSLPTPEFPKQQRVKGWEKSDNPKKSLLRRKHVLCLGASGFQLWGKGENSAFSFRRKTWLEVSR